MKITVPESINDIKLHQFQEYNNLITKENVTDLEIEVGKIAIFTGIESNRVSLLAVNDYNDILQTIDLALNQTVDFKPTFFIGDVEFGFIPNFDKITMAEFRDISLYEKDVSDMNKLMAVLFRPIKNKDVLGNYSIIEYQGTEQYAKIMKYMPLSIVNGSLVFFSSLANELVNFTQKYMVVEPVRENKRLSFLRNGVGMQRFLNFAKVKFGNLKRC